MSGRVCAKRVSILMVVCALLAACGKPSAPAVQKSNTPATSAEVVSKGSQQGETADSFFDPKNYPNAVQGSFVDPQKLTASERKYGMAPKRDPRVTYQDGIILMEHGDEAIREAKTDGMTFSFNAKAEHVDEFQVGKIVFATGRVVGRIGQVKQDGDTVTVKLAPITLTDVIKKGTFLMDSSFSAKDLLFYTAPDFPNTIDNTASQQSSELLRETNEPRYIRAQFPPGMSPLASGLAKDLSTTLPPKYPTLSAPQLNLSKGLLVQPAVGSDGGIGISFNYVKNGVVFDATGQLVLPAPRVRFLLDIDASGINTFGIEISGDIGLRISIVATSNVERYINVDSTSITPIDITLPCPLAGVPLALNFRTSFTLHTKFAAKSSTLTSSGAWSMKGTLFVGKKDRKDSVTKPDVKNTSSLAANVSGISAGINTVGGGVNIQPMIGLGGFGFMTGVFLGVTFTAEVGKQASEAQFDCHLANGSASVNSGVGYKVPKAFAQLINGVLALFTEYRLDVAGTLIPGPGGSLFDRYESIPAGCAPVGGKSTKKT